MNAAIGYVRAAGLAEDAQRVILAALAEHQAALEDRASEELLRLARMAVALAAPGRSPDPVPTGPRRPTPLRSPSLDEAPIGHGDGRKRRSAPTGR